MVVVTMMDAHHGRQTATAPAPVEWSCCCTEYPTAWGGHGKTPMADMRVLHRQDQEDQEGQDVSVTDKRHFW